MRISSQLLTNELVLRFLSEPPQFSTNSPTVALHCCHVLSDELSPVNVGGQISTTYIDALLTIFEEKPGLRPQWQCQVFHCGTVTGTGNYSASFSTISWPFLLGGGAERWPSTSDQESCGLQKNSNVGEEVTLSMLLPHGGTISSLHIVTLNILKFCQGHPPSTRTVFTAIHLRRWGGTEEWHL